MGAEFMVEQSSQLDPTDFVQDFVRRRRPVLVKGALAGSSALARWTLQYLREHAGVREVPLKTLHESNIEVVRKPLDDYLSELEAHEARSSSGGTVPEPAYLHDIPLTALLPRAADDLEQFPAAYFPAWYRGNWTNFAQVFLGPTGSLTPLHFDCLLTHNLFFQIRGRKRFILIPAEQLKFCYRHSWRWCEVDAEKPDLERFPLYAEAQPIEFIVEPGDCLYLPPGMLHHVRSLDCALSFNVDWHTRDSAARGMLALFDGMPIKNVYYNAVIALGMWAGIPAEAVFGYYRSYLNYIS